MRSQNIVVSSDEPYSEKNPETTNFPKYRLGYHDIESAGRVGSSSHESDSLDGVDHILFVQIRVEIERDLGVVTVRDRTELGLRWGDLELIDDRR